MVLGTEQDCMVMASVAEAYPILDKQLADRLSFIIESLGQGMLTASRFKSSMTA